MERALCSVLVLLVALALPPAVRGDDFTPVVGSVVSGDTMALRGSDGRMHVVYELLLSNARAVPATLEQVDVLRAGDEAQVLASLSGERLEEALHTLDARPAHDAALPPNESRILFVHLDFASAEDVPAGLVHRLQGRGGASPAAREPSALRYTLAPVTLSDRRLPVLGPPLGGDGWVAFNGCCSGGGAHRGAILPVNGRLWDAQRFAIDWLKLDDEGRLVTGDLANPESWVGYGAPVLAAASGTVVSAGDGLPDQVPGKLPDPSTITVANVDGNHVVLDHGDGVFTFYAHLRPGSVAVQTGDRVAAGQRLGDLGNTGNSSAPHLHFHVMTGPSPLGSDGIPYEIDRFTWTQQVADVDVDRLLAGGRLVAPAATPVAIERSLPLDQNVVDFGPRRAE
jgi:murein DD-endopeptidase MepM/ murein hydrolase activator NlpD